MSRASYPVAVDWIAANDEPLETDATEIGRQITVLLVADTWGYDPDRVARDVVKARAAMRRRGEL